MERTHARQHRCVEEWQRRDIRDIANRELKRRRGKPHQLALAVIDQVSTTAVYNFLNGKTDPSLSVLGVILDGLELELVPKKKPAAVSKAMPHRVSSGRTKRRQPAE